MSGGVGHGCAGGALEERRGAYPEGWAGRLHRDQNVGRTGGIRHGRGRYAGLCRHGRQTYGKDSHRGAGEGEADAGADLAAPVGASAVPAFFERGRVLGGP